MKDRQQHFVVATIVESVSVPQKPSCWWRSTRSGSWRRRRRRRRSSRPPMASTPTECWCSCWLAWPPVWRWRLFSPFCGFGWLSLRASGFPYQKVRAQLFRSSAMAPARSATAWIKSSLGSLVSKMLKPPSTSNIWPPARATRLVGPSSLG